MKDSPIFLIMGFVHICAGFVLLIGGSEPMLYLSQTIGGFLEFGLGFYLYIGEIKA
jgi:hypothetical protein